MIPITQVRVGAQNKKNLSYLNRETTIVPTYRLNLNTAFHVTIEHEQLYSTLRCSCLTLQVLVRMTIINDDGVEQVWYEWQDAPKSIKPFFKDSGIKKGGNTVTIQGNSLYIEPPSGTSATTTAINVQFKLNNISKKSDAGKISHQREPLYRFLTVHHLVDKNNGQTYFVFGQEQPCIFGIVNSGNFDVAKATYHSIVAELTCSQSGVDFVEGGSDKEDVIKNVLRQMLNNLGAPVQLPPPNVQIDNASNHCADESDQFLSNEEAFGDTSDTDDCEAILNSDLDEVVQEANTYDFIFDFLDDTKFFL